MASAYSPPVQTLIDELGRLPGIGPRSAQRIAFHLLKIPSDDVMRLADDLNDGHWKSPIFWPILHVAEPAAREFNLAALRGSETPYFVAYEEGKPVGMQTFLRPGFTPPIVKRETDVYLFEGIVARDARSGGIGGALLQHSMEWAARSGFESCTLHFAPGNPSGAPFWLGHGFVPVEHTMERTVDARVAWARPKHL